MTYNQELHAHRSLIMSRLEEDPGPEMTHVLETLLEEVDRAIARDEKLDAYITENDGEFTLILDGTAWLGEEEHDEAI